jgi:hypothetical protein
MLNAVRFNEQFATFTVAAAAAQDGEAFVGFDRGVAERWEGYKERLYHEGRKRLDRNTWRESDIGKGAILQRVLLAIEINEPGLRNNLVQWQGKWGQASRSHVGLLAAVEDSAKRRDTESLLFALYRGGRDLGEVFAGLVTMVGRRYDLLAYLYFLRDWDRFMPIATATFDEAFELLGIDLRTSGQCSWANYQRYIGALQEVREALAGKGIESMRLVDAHSFLWMLVRLPPEERGVPTSAVASAAQITHATAAPRGASSGDNTGPSRPVDFGVLNERRVFLGKLGEQTVERYERNRLRDAGRADLADRVSIVSEDPRLGYDIDSFDLDGSPRYIEVKCASGSGERIEFYLSENERRKSAAMSNYWFYLVFDVESMHPRIRTMRGELLPPGSLSPQNYLVSLVETSSTSA